MESGRECLPVAGASEMSFEGGVSQSAYNTLASLNLPKPEKGRKPLTRLPSIRCLPSKPVGRIRRSRRIRHEIRRTGHQVARCAILSGRRKAIWHTPAGPHPESYNKQPLTMLFDVFSNTRGDAHTGNRRRIDHRQFLNVVIWRYPIMLRQQMAEFHGEMPSAQSKISLALPRSHCPHCQQTIRVRDNIPLLSG